MATIPLGDYGNAVAASGPQVNVQRGDPMADAMNRTGQLAQGLNNELAERDQQQRAAQASLALAKTNNALHDAHDEVARGLLDGSIDPDKAQGEFQKRASQAKDQTLDGFDPYQRDQMDAHLTNTVGTLQRSLNGVIFKRNQQDTASTIDQFGEQVSREAMRQGPGWATEKYGAMVDFSGPAAGLNPAQIAKLKQGFAEKTNAEFFQNAAVGALTDGNVEALRKIREQVQGPQGDILDPQRRAILTHQMFGWEQHILAQKDRAANQAEEQARKQYNDAADLFNKGSDIALGGGFFSPEFITQMVSTAQGTDMEKPVANLIASQRAIAGFASLPADQRDSQIERARSERATPGQGTDPMNEKLITAMGTMNDKLKRQSEENPWAAAQSAGVIKDAPVINLTDPTSAIQAIQQRMQQIGTVEAWTGKRASPLQPQEVEQLQKFVRQLPIDQEGTMLANIGDALGNSDRVAALAKQIHDKDGTLGLAMMYASQQTTEGRKTAELVLRGEQALKDSTSLVDKTKDSGWMATIAKQVRGAYSNREAEDQVIDASFKIASAIYAGGGGTDLDRAVRLATGGIIERNGQKVPLPYGMNEAEFDKKIGSIDAATITQQAPGGNVYAGRTPMPIDQFVQSLPKATLVHAGQGLYNVRAGTSLITNDHGQRITLKVNQ